MAAHRHEYGGPSRVEYSIGPSGYEVRVLLRPRCECGARPRLRPWLRRLLTGYKLPTQPWPTVDTAPEIDWSR